jgi:hypothetical protein
MSAALTMPAPELPAIAAEINGKTILRHRTLAVAPRFPDGTIRALNRVKGRISLRKRSGTV